MKAILNWRYYVLIIIGTVSVVAIFGVPEDSLPMGEWMTSLLISKGIGVLAIYVLNKLISHWEARNLIPEFTDMYQEEEDEL